MIYTHVLNQGGLGVKSPFDDLGCAVENCSLSGWTDRPNFIRHTNAMAWFARDYTDRALSANERQFMAALADMVTRLAVPQLDENETALTAEGEHCLIILMPQLTLETTIRLVDPMPPPVTEPSGVDGWFGSSSRGA